jgi:hypothetical protein
MPRMVGADPSALIARLRDRLLQSAHPDGGWAYYAGKRPRIEPTSWAVLALSDTGVSSDLAPHFRFLAACQRFDGVLLDIPNGPPNLASNAIAALALAHLSPSQGPPLPKLLEGLLTVKGVKVDVVDPRQNNQLQGWPWLPGTFSWVEPTSWCVLALKKAPAPVRPSATAARIAEAEALLDNRACESGGWNFGNATALGQDLRAYVPTSALALLALQNLRTPVVERSLAYLDRARVSEPSAMALSLTAICLRVFNRESADVDARLAAGVERIERLGNLHAIAMTLYALAADRHGVRAFRV